MLQGKTTAASTDATAAGGALSPVRMSFIRSVGRSLKGTRLGDLLVTSRLISATELDEALRIQKSTREQLGTILVREGFISPVQLYRKLAEQWCLRASAAGLTLMIETFTPDAAHAGETTATVQVAAAFSTAARPIDRPDNNANGLFGTAEIKSTDISSFTKWTSVMLRFETQMKDQNTLSSPRMTAWKEKIKSLRGKSAREQIEGVNDFMNSVRYIEDKNNYGASDKWATPVEFMARGGDCEDYAIAKYASLRALGYSAEQLRIAIVQDKIKNIAHAILIVYTDEGTFVLDNQNKRAERAENVARYTPVFSINSSGWWLHRSPAGA